MAQIHEEVVVIRVSKLVREKQKGEGQMVTEDVLAALEQFIAEAIGDQSVVVEAASDQD